MSLGKSRDYWDLKINVGDSRKGLDGFLLKGGFKMI
jgi:hypothetical protein